MRWLSCPASSQVGIVNEGGPTVFAGFGVGQAGAQSGAVPLGAMQLSRCPDRPRLEAVTMPEEGLRPHANEARPRNLGKLMGGTWLVPCLGTLVPSLSAIPSQRADSIISWIVVCCGVGTALDTRSRSLAAISSFVVRLSNLDGHHTGPWLQASCQCRSVDGWMDGWINQQVTIDGRVV